MGLPAMTPDGYLPPGRHRATLDDLQQRFVREAPHSWDREGLFQLLRRHLRALASITGSTPVWIGGGLISHSPTADEDVMVLGMCRDVEHLKKCFEAPGCASLLTIDEAIFGYPFMAGAVTLLPFGGDIDASLATPEDAHIWDGIFSTLHGQHDRGYVEVVL